MNQFLTSSYTSCSSKLRFYSGPWSKIQIYDQAMVFLISVPSRLSRQENVNYIAN